MDTVASSLTAALPNPRLAGKVAIVTGGASGIGASTVRLFHENGAMVVIADIQDDLGQALASELGQNVCYIRCDVRREEEVSDLVDTTISKFGKLDIMYNNAGVIDGYFTRLLDTTKSDIEKVVGVNMVGSFLGAKHAARVMVPQRQGCILFTSSIGAEIGGLGTPAYNMTKAGITGLVTSLAAELGEYGIRVNCISPYAVVTSMGSDHGSVAQIGGVISAAANLKGKVLKAEDIGRAALYLASDEANYVSGLNLVVDGGYTKVNPSMKNIMQMALNKQ